MMLTVPHRLPDNKMNAQHITYLEEWMEPRLQKYSKPSLPAR